MQKKIKTSELFTVNSDFLKPLFTKYEYPWEIIPQLIDFANEIIACGLDGYTELRPGVLVGKDVTIHESACIEAPVIIGHGTEIRIGAFIRGGSIIGDNCVIGNSTEIKNSVLLDNVEVPHYNYVGDSILGCYAHMGAGSICSNLKSDKSNVVINADEKIDTGLTKLGSMLADHAEIGCGAVLNPGTIVGKNTTVYPLTPARGVYPADSIVKSAKVVVKKNPEKLPLPKRPFKHPRIIK